jgi:hypothetical protein
MRRTAPVLLALLVVTPIVAALQQPPIADPQTRDICAAASRVEWPSADRPGPADRAALAGCVSLDLYYGLGVARDRERARKCAFLEMDAADASPVLGGRAVLMMVYANGQGAARDFDVALRAACEIEGAPQDLAGRVRQLAQLKAARWTGDRFSICDHSSGRPLYEHCAILQERFDRPVREKAVDALVATWTPAQRTAFQAFRQAADRFFQAHASREANLEATFEVQERAFLEDNLLAALQSFERDERPRHSAADLRQAESALDAAYASTQQGARHWGTVTAAGIGEAQRAWTAYRDAWVRFARTRYPSVSADSWRTWLAEQRLGMLDRFR